MGHRRGHVCERMGASLIGTLGDPAKATHRSEDEPA